MVELILGSWNAALIQPSLACDALVGFCILAKTFHLCSTLSKDMYTFQGAPLINGYNSFCFVLLSDFLWELVVV